VDNKTVFGLCTQGVHKRLLAKFYRPFLSLYTTELMGRGKAIGSMIGKTK
jgi:hypothetical protein